MTTDAHTFQTSNLVNRNIENIGQVNQKQVFILMSGRESLFELKKIDADAVGVKTFVIQETNGRDQNSLTPSSLSDITRTIKIQQFYPCIGIQRGDKIEIIDGSRRRAAAMLCNRPLTVMVTRDDISLSEARALAKDIQSSREHNLREIGMRLKKMKDAGLTQKEISTQERLSEAKVTRALQAASVPQILINVFPDQSELTFNDYKKLIEINDACNKRNIKLNELLNNVEDEVNGILNDNTFDSEVAKKKILEVIQKSTCDTTFQVVQNAATTTILWEFDSKDRYARKKVKERAFSYEFNRLPKEIQAELDEVIQFVLESNLTKKC